MNVCELIKHNKNGVLQQNGVIKSDTLMGYYNSYTILLEEIN